MKKCKECGENKGIDFFEQRKDLSNRLVCKQCVSVKKKNYYIKNKERICTVQKIAKDKNKDKLKVTRKEYYLKNKGAAYERRKKRSIATIKQTPCWLTFEQRKEIRAFYKKAKEISISTGIKHSVDHIVPITSKYVCGLHISCNLRIIPLSDNLSKRNAL